MCGIAGVFGLTPSASSFERLVDALAHRGPDAGGRYADAVVTLIMHRLKFRGADCALPVREANAVSAFNGQIYGWRTTDGTYHRLQEGLTEELAVAAAQSVVDGMFAYARYLPQDGRVELATDAHFIKPLFVRCDVQSVAFASEMAPLLAALGPSLIDMQALAELFAYGWYLSDQSCAADVSLVWKHDFALGPGGVQRSPKRARLAPVPSRPSAAQLRAAIRTSVSRSVEGAGPLGLALSGGLDSSILAAELNALGIEGLVCVTVQLAESGGDIASLAELGLPAGGAWQSWKHVVVPVDDHDFLSGFEAATRMFGQPTSMSSLPLYQCLADAASQAGVRALLLGEGVDEYFAGYVSYAKVCALRSPLDYYRHPARERLVRRLFGAARLERTQLRFAQMYGQMTDLRPVEAQLRLTRLLLRSDVCLMSRSIEGRVPFLYNDIPALALALPWAELAAAPGKTALRAAYADSLGERSMCAKVRFKSSDAMLLRCLGLQRLESRIVARCAGLFGRSAVLEALAMLRTPEGFDADILCLLMSLTFLIEGELLHDDIALTKSPGPLYA